MCFPAALFAQNVVTVSSGATYTYSTDNSGQITSITNDDGTQDAYEFDAYGSIIGINVFAGNTVLNVRYIQSGSGQIVDAPGLAAIVVNADSNGRTSEVVVHPEISVGEGGELEVEAGGWWYSPPPPSTAATLAYGTNGYLTQATLNGGLALQLTAPDSAGIVHQTLYGSTGNIVAQANASGSIPGIHNVPAYLDAVASEAGLGSQWADSLSFETSADGHLTTAFNSSSQPVLYMVNIGEIRVGFSPQGTALFYDVMPTYEATVGTLNEGDPLDVAPQMAAVSPNHIVVTASGHTGFYMDHPADGAIYSAWNELDASGNETQPYAVLDMTFSSSLKMRGASDGKRLTSRGNLLRLYQTTVCVGNYCWTRTWSSEWNEGGTSGGGGSAPPGYTVPPGSGGTAGTKPGNNVPGIPGAKVARAIPNAKEKLKDPKCQALLNQGDLYSLLDPGVTRSLLWNMQARGFTDPGAYLNSLDFRLGMSSADCPGGSNTNASTKPFSALIHICPGFSNATEGLAADYLIHEMLHSLGLPENPPTKGAKSSSQINDMVRAACGS